MRKDKGQKGIKVKGKTANMFEEKLADLLFCGLPFR